MLVKLQNWLRKRLGLFASSKSFDQELKAFDNEKALIVMEDIKEIKHPTILIRISKAYNDSLSERELYDYTRGYWVVDQERASKADYAFAVYKGEVKEVYVVDKWVKAMTTESIRKNEEDFDKDAEKTMNRRSEFVGCVAPQHIRNEFIGMSVALYFKKGNSNPITYINM